MATANTLSVTAVQLKTISVTGEPEIRRVHHTVTSGGAVNPKTRPHACAVLIPIDGQLHTLKGRRGGHREWQDLNRLEAALRDIDFNKLHVINELD
jgi:hypothetical protein